MAGTIFIKPSEAAGFSGYKGSASVYIPATGQSYNPATGKFTRGWGGAISDPRQLLEARAVAARAAAQAAAQARAKAKEIERKRIEELERLKQQRILTQQQATELTRLKVIETRRQRGVFEAGTKQDVKGKKIVIQPTVKPKVKEDIKAKAQRLGVSFFTPSIAPAEVKTLPEKERGVAAAKTIFLGGFEGLYQYAKKGTREVDFKIPQYTGILTPIVGKKKSISLGKVKPAQVIAELIPRTTAEILAIRYFPKLPKVVQIPITGAVTRIGVVGTLDTSRTKEERIASGLIAVGAGIGTVAQVTPYLRGLKAQTIGKLTGKYKPIKVQAKGFKAIQLKETRIGLIPEQAPLKIGITKEVKLPTISPLKRGGFSVKPSEKALFLGKGQTVATSQRGLFKEGVTIKPTLTAPKEFFVSPQDPFAKIPVTRVSRLGLEQPLKVPKQVKIGFGLPKKPQIGLEYGATIARMEKGGAYRIGTGTELEAIKTMPTIKVGKQLGVTTIKGQAIDIFQIKTTPTKGVSKLLPKVPTTAGVTRVSGEAALVSYKVVPRPTTPTTQIVRLAPTLPTLPVSVPVTPPTRGLSRKPTKPTSPLIIPKPSPPHKRISKDIFTSIRLLTTKSVRRPTRTLSLVSPRITPTKKPPVMLRLKPKRKRKEELFPTYGVAVRRRGKFKSIGTGLSLKKAFSLGTLRTARTLGATFKILGPTKRLKTPFGYYQKPTKTGTLFIEKRGLRLSTRPEVSEIHRAKRRKR